MTRRADSARPGAAELEPLALYRQDVVLDLLRRRLAKGHLPPAILFTGPAGVGKERIALWVAQAANCARGWGDPCGECPGCHKVLRLQHPDVLWLPPLPPELWGEGRDDERGDYLIHARERRLESPFAPPEEERKTAHGIGAIRFVRARAQRRPFEGRTKVFLFRGADRMTEEAANAFLKLLEEPPPSTLLLLTAEVPAALPLTVLSRCEQVRVPPLSDHEVRAALGGEGVRAELVPLAAGLGQGSLGRALQALQAGDLRPGLRETRRSVEEIIEISLAPGADKRYAFVLRSRFVRGREGYRGLMEILDLLELWLRDLLVLRARGEEELVANVDRIGVLRTLAGRIRGQRILEAQSVVAEVRRDLERNVSLPLALWSLMAGLSRSLAREWEVPQRAPRAPGSPGVSASP